MNVRLIDASTGEAVTVPTDWIPNGAAITRSLPGGASLEARDLDPHQLRIDPDYQRTVRKDRVRAMAAAWDDRLAFAVTVSARGAHDYVIIDGQHRVAAALHAGIEQVPCLVLYGLSKREEAALFTRLSTQRLPLSTKERFRARLAAGDPVCEYILAAVHECGYRVVLEGGTHPGGDDLDCVAALETIYRRGTLARPRTQQVAPVEPNDGMAAIRRVLYTTRTCFPNQKDAKQHDMLLGLHTFWAYYSADVSLDDLAHKLRHMTATDVLRRALGHRQTIGGSRPLWVAHILLEVYNSSKRANRLPNRMPLPGGLAGGEEAGHGD